MKDQPKKLTRSTAMAALLANVFVMPGVGTWMTGRRKTGLVQAVLSLLGVLMMTAWLVWFVARWITQEQMPQNLGPFAWVAGLGMVIFGAAWLWSVANSVADVRAAGANPATTAGNENAAPPKLN